jgi:2-polyprenyl-3-methyl-5-hydroxy-6-metoxy-1,4-benzoquinol methylase
MSDSLQAAFDAHALSYEERWNADPVARAMRLAVWRVAAAVFPEGGRILDIGCGVGVDAQWLVASGRTVLAVDQSAGMVHATQTRVPGAEVRQLSVADPASMEALANEGPFDGALLNFGVINCLDPAQFAQLLAPCLAPGAPVIIVTMPRIAPRWLLHQLLRLRLGSVWRRLKRETEVVVEGTPVHTRYHGANTLRAACAEAFEAQLQQGLGFLLPPPCVGASPTAVALWEQLERPLRSWPVFRSLGDHLIVVLRRRSELR